MLKKQDAKSTERVITIWKNIDQLSEAAAHFFMDHCLQTIAVKGYFAVALSGGNTPRTLYKLLASPPFLQNIPWKKVFFFWSDERFVPATHQDSNYGMAKKLLLDHTHVPAKNIFPIKGFGDPEERAQEYEHTLKLFFHNKKPVFDLILLGVGEDGHTASLFPGSELLLEKKRWIKPVWAEEKKSWRISFTLPLINHATAVLFLVSGSEKKDIIKKLLRKKKNYSLPAELVMPHNGMTYWMLDEAAAHKKPFIITYSSDIARPPRIKHE